jgi:Glutaredoxin and related proteins
MALTVYSKDRCVQCDATKRFLKINEIEHAVEDATAEENLVFLKELGYTQVPVTVISEGDEIVNHWYGYNIDELNKLKAA